MGTSITQNQNTSAAEACLEAINARFEGTGVSIASSSASLAPGGRGRSGQIRPDQAGSGEVGRDRVGSGEVRRDQAR